MKRRDNWGVLVLVLAVVVLVAVVVWGIYRMRDTAEWCEGVCRAGGMSCEVAEARTDQDLCFCSDGAGKPLVVFTRE